MRIRLNDKEIVFPSSLSEITIGQRIDYYNQYGRDLDKMADSINSMKDGIDKELEASEFHFEKMFRTFAFFSNATLESVKESEFVEDIAKIYYSCLAVLVDDEQKVEIEKEIFWNDEIWMIDPPELSAEGKMKFGQFVDAKQIVKDLVELGAGRWEYMQRLCAIYLRKKDEPYTDELAGEGSERVELMKDLPMNIALQVGFFLSAITNSSLTILNYLQNPELKEEESI